MIVRLGVIEFEIRKKHHYGLPDEFRTVHMSIYEIDKLALLAAKEPEDFDYIEFFWIPRIRRWVMFVHRHSVPVEFVRAKEECDGPFLSQRFTPPSSYDTAADDKEVFVRIVRSYGDT
jgi:hypothetical protein